MTDLPRALGRPCGNPLYAWIRTDGTMRGYPCTFPDASKFDPEYPIEAVQRDGTRYLPIYGDEPACDIDRQYFMDSYEIQGDRVIRTRVVHDRNAA